MDSRQSLPCAKIIRGQQCLTVEQVTSVRQFVQERRAAMLSCAAVDETEAEEHLRDAYRVVRLEPPRLRWFDSPFAFTRAAFSSRTRAAMGKSVMRKVWSQPQSKINSSILNALGKELWACIWNTLDAGLWDAITPLVGRSVRNSSSSKWYSPWNLCESYTAEHWLTVTRLLHELFEENALIHLARFNEMVSTYQLRSEEAWIVRKPIRLQRDEQGCLHSSSGMCMQYPDGWGFYAWHGVLVPEKLILHPEHLTREDWLAEDNSEVRRVMQERLGHARFVELIGGTCIDQGMRGDLIAVDLGNDPEGVAHYVRVQDSSTQRQYYLRVPPSISRADEAVAWTFGLDEQGYQPIQQT